MRVRRREAHTADGRTLDDSAVGKFGRSSSSSGRASPACASAEGYGRAAGAAGGRTLAQNRPQPVAENLREPAGALHWRALHPRASRTHLRTWRARAPRCSVACRTRRRPARARRARPAHPRRALRRRPSSECVVSTCDHRMRWGQSGSGGMVSLELSLPYRHRAESVVHTKRELPACETTLPTQSRTCASVTAVFMSKTCAQFANGLICETIAPASWPAGRPAGRTAAALRLAQPHPKRRTA
jgi:hypothetical protein